MPHLIASPQKYRLRKNNCPPMSICIKEIAVNYKIWRKQEIWQLCCANMAMLLVITFSKYIQRDVSSSKTWVWRKELSFFSIRTKDMQKTGEMAKNGNLANL